MSWHLRAGLLMFRFVQGELQVFLAHSGRPDKDSPDESSWTLPKGGRKRHETMLQAAQREFEEEVGIVPRGPYLDLGSIQQKNGKMVHIWAFQGEWDDTQPIRSPIREMTWPTGSNQLHTFPEFDLAQFFPLPDARQRINSRYKPLLDRLISLLGTDKTAIETL